MYPAVSVPDIMTTPTPKLGERIIDKLHQLIGEMEANMVQSRYAYPAAEAELLDRIGWDELREKPEELSCVRRFADLASSARFDSEFFRPSPNRVRAWLAKNGAKTIGELCHFVEHGIQPTYIEGGTVGIVSQRQFRTSGLDLDLLENFTNESFLLENPKFRILKSDVLTYCVSAGEYLGRTFLFNSDIPCVAASFVTILRTKDVIPGYMALFLNSPAGLIQSNMFKRGTSPFYLYPRDLKQVLIPLPRQKNGEVDIAWQKRLAAKVEAATAAKVAARAKLEEAKHLVEDALTS
jgi:type I restriction enzyme S subunit